MAKNLNIDLGREYNLSEMAVPSKSENRKSYPTLYLDTEQELDLPSDGEMVIQFHKCSSNESENDEGECKYSCTIEVRKIVSVDGKEVQAPSKKDTSAADALDALMKAARKQSDDTEE